jgi:hypothetical protein
VSVAEPTVTLDPEIRAAIFWDVRALRGGSSAAQNLLAAFGAPPRRLSEDAKGPLQIAVIGVLAFTDRSDTAEALSAWALLLESKSADERLLGHLLRLWVGLPSDARAIELRDALNLARRVADEEDRARLCLKVAIAADDTGHVALAKEAGQAALESAPEGAEVRRATHWFLYDLDRSVGLPAVGGFDDDLLTQPWLTDEAWSAAVEADLNQFQDQLAGVWGGSIRMGQTPLDVLNAVQRQAAWAGLTSRRDAVTRLMCSHVLMSPRESRQNVQWAAGAWVLAGGGNISNVLASAEPNLDAEFAHGLIEQIVQMSRLRTLPQVARSIWRLVSEPDVDQLLTLLDPGMLQQPEASDAREAWANLVWRDPVLWHAHWMKLDPSRKLSAVSEALPHVTERLPEAIAVDMLSACEDASPSEQRQVAAIGAALAAVLGRDSDPWLLNAPPGDVLQVAHWRRSVVTDEALDRVTAELLKAGTQRRDGALSGQWSIGGSQTFVMLGDATALAGVSRPDVEDLLLTVIATPAMTSDDQIGAVEGLATLHRSGQLSPEAETRLHELNLEPGRGIFSQLEPTALRAAQLFALGDTLSRDEQTEVLVGCRAPSEQTRLFAVAALESILSSDEGHPGAAWTLLSAAYDPADSVLVRALDILGRSPTRVDPAVASAYLAAVANAYQTGKHDVRRAAVVAARALADASGDAGAIERVLREAGTDQSWEIREIVAGRL